MGRLDVIETGRRRRWTPDQKAAIVAESFSTKLSVCEVARRHGIAPSQLFGWRRDARLPIEETGFAPAVLVESGRESGSRLGSQEAPVIVVELASGGRVVIGERASAAVVSAVLKTLRR